VVVVAFDDKITFEVLPVFETTDGQSWMYPNANDGGSWRFCSPRAEIAAIQTRSSVTNRDLKQGCPPRRCRRSATSSPSSSTWCRRANCGPCQLECPSADRRAQGTWILFVTRNWRITFRIDQDEIEIIDLDYEDYH
jgi:hypothetical protein